MRPARSFRPTLHTSVAVRTGWHGSRTKLRRRDAPNFLHAQPELFSCVASAVCNAEVLPRKELYECWEVACHVDARFPTAERVADLAAGHGLLGWMLLLLAATDGRRRTAVCVDVRMPASADTLGAAMLERWPELQGSLDYVEGGLEKVQADSGILLTAVHACGPLTDAVLERAVSGGAPVAVMPCCHSLRKQPLPPVPGLTLELLTERATAMGAIDAIDGARVDALSAAGYSVEERRVDPAVTPYNRLLLAEPPVPTVADVAAAAAESADGYLEPPPSQGRLHRQLRTIPLGDLAVIRAIAGRRPFESVRSIVVSVWLPETHPFGHAALEELAHWASAAAWRPLRGPHSKPSPDEGKDESELLPRRAAENNKKENLRKEGGQNQTGTAHAGSAPPSSRYWDVEAAVAAARARALSSTSASAMRPHARAGGPSGAVSVEVTLRETYRDEGSGRRSCAYAIDFISHERELTRGDVGMWQARVREALQLWAAHEAAPNEEEPLEGAFELR